MKKIIVTLSLLATSLFGSSEVENRVKAELLSNGVKFDEVKCIGVLHQNCEISNLVYLEGNRTTATLKSLVLENAERLNTLNSLEELSDGTYPIAVSAKNLDILEYDSGLFVDSYQDISLKLIATISQNKGILNLNLDELYLENRYFGVSISFQIKGRSQEDIAVKSLGLFYEDRGLIEGLLVAVAKDENRTVAEVKAEIESSAENEIVQYSGVLKEIVEATLKIVTGKATSINISIKTKDGEYIKAMDLYTRYSMAMMFGIGDEFLNSVLDIKVESK
jgi:hypothetical protein